MQTTTHSKDSGNRFVLLLKKTISLKSTLNNSEINTRCSWIDHGLCAM